MDLDTFFTELYVLIDDWYKASWETTLARGVGVKPQMSDSEVLTVLVAGQWQVGVAWRSERGLLRWLDQHGRGWFPDLLKRSAFNQRARNLWSVCIALQQAVADQLGCQTAAFECVDGEPVPAYILGQACRETQHWLWESKRGHGGTGGGWFIGNRLLASVTDTGILTGWLLATANVSERFVLQALLSARAGCPSLDAPASVSHKRPAERLTPPVERIGPFQAVGRYTPRPYLADRGFNGQAWLDQWHAHPCALVVAPSPPKSPQPWSSALIHTHAAARQVIETVFAVLAEVFALKRVNAHSFAALYPRVAAKAAAFNVGLSFNRALSRPDFAHATLLC